MAVLVVQCVYHDRHSKGPKILSAEQRATDKAHEQLRAGRQARHGTLVCGVMRRALRFMGMYMYMGGWALLSGLYRLISGAALACFFAMAALLLFSVLLALERPPALCLCLGLLCRAGGGGCAFWWCYKTKKACWFLVFSKLRRAPNPKKRRGAPVPASEYR